LARLLWTIFRVHLSWIERHLPVAHVIARLNESPSSFAIPTFTVARRKFRVRRAEDFDQFFNEEVGIIVLLLRVFAGRGDSFVVEVIADFVIERRTGRLCVAQIMMCETGMPETLLNCARAFVVTCSETPTRSQERKREFFLSIREHNSLGLERIVRAVASRSLK